MGDVARVRARGAVFQELLALRGNREKRKKEGAFFVEGVLPISQALKHGWAFRAFAYDEGRALSQWARRTLDAAPNATRYALAGGLMAELSGKTDASEIVAVVNMRATLGAAMPPARSHPSVALAQPVPPQTPSPQPPPSPQPLSPQTPQPPSPQPPSPQPHLPQSPLLLLYDRPSSHGNLGAVFRSCDAFGADAIYISGHAVDPYDPAVVAASTGSFFAVPFGALPSHADALALIAACRAACPGFQVVGTTAHRQTALAGIDLTLPTLLLLGNEARGLSRALSQACDALATIPMSPAAAATSLNASCAASILLYEAARQRASAA